MARGRQANQQTGRVVLVTGASAGIGKAVVRRLLADGWRVWAAARRSELMADLATLGARVVVLDVTDDAGMQRVVTAILAAEGRLDALVNNAGYGSYGAIEDVPLAEARRQFEVNVFGLARLIQLVLPAMRAAGHGRIVNVSSMGGRIWTPVGGWYHATKHAVEVLSDALRLEVRPFGIEVVVVQPGSIATEWGEIAARNLLATARGSAYGELIAPMAELLRGPGAAPEVVASAVAEAVGARRPRRRYATPRDAKLLIFLRWLLPDAAFERLLGLFFAAARRRVAQGGATARAAAG